MAPLLSKGETEKSGPPSGWALAGKSFDLVTLTVTTVLSAITFKALIDRVLNHAIEKVVQYMTTRQLRKWQKHKEEIKLVTPKVSKAREWHETAGSNVTASWNKTL